MGILYKISNKQSLKDRNEIFKDVGFPALEANGFVRSVFETSWDGQYDKSINGYTYQLYRLIEGKLLENINVNIVGGDKWIKIHLNVFELSPALNSIKELSKCQGINFSMSPNNSTQMRLRSDDYKGPPLFYMLFLPEHKIGNFQTKSGYTNSIEKLKKLIKSDMNNIDGFVKRWHELHKTNLTDWEGNIIR